MIINLIVLSALYLAFYLLLKYPWKKRETHYLKAKKPTKAQLLDMKLTYSSPEMSDMINSLDEHEAAISR